MSPNSLRVLAGAAAAVLALLTAIAVGFVSRASECVPAQGPPGTPTSAPPSPAPSPTATPTSRPPLGQLEDNTRPETNTSAPPPVTASPSGRPATVAAPVGCANEKTEAFAPIPAVTALAGTGLTAAVVLGLLLLAGARRAAPRGSPARPGGVAGPPPPGDPAPRLDADRAALVRACIYVRDRVTSRALADRLAAALHDAGVSSVEPVGERFDPGRHEAGGATPAADPALTGTIAAVEVPGYVDRTGRVLRAPVVTVYQAGPPTGQRPPSAKPARRTEEDR